MYLLMVYIHPPSARITTTVNYLSSRSQYLTKSLLAIHVSVLGCLLDCLSFFSSIDEALGASFIDNGKDVGLCLDKS